ncbi:OmpA family protein [Qipengyuania nanhaisediminis]|uniref:Outer membrane protein OmpA n=1 Tax=Qipengyuania nanhaisediminis TaxID=604088 RepID=A0A1I5K9T2_9SPHN|nr:OmpA family protein [Qipengyuania nanhaisediminis]SFO81779.1 Outer membrane protein OmpA [Qipengyuania nanhaisediminis]
MRTAFLVPLTASFVALAGCGATSETPDDRNETAASPEAPEDERSSPATAVDQGQGPLSNLSARTSSLTAIASDLNSRIVGTNRIVELPADVLFDFDSAELKPEAETALRQVAEAIRAAPQGGIAIVGHTDSKGSDSYNDDLSQRRAQAVRDWMASQVGVRQREFTLEGAGESEPLAPNANSDGTDSEHGRARNRRVEVVIPIA